MRGAWRWVCKIFCRLPLGRWIDTSDIPALPRRGYNQNSNFGAPCKCGSAPVCRQGQKGGACMLQLWCACGNPHGAVLMYTKPEDKARMVRAGIDGWNLSG